MVYVSTEAAVCTVLQILLIKTAVQRLHVYSMRFAHGVLIPCLAKQTFPTAPMRHLYVGCGAANPHVSYTFMYIVHAHLKELEQAAATSLHQQRGKTSMC